MEGTVTPANTLGNPQLESVRNGSNTVHPEGSSLSPTRPAAPRRATTTTKTGLIFRRPGVDPPDFSPPPLPWLAGTWYFTHSTLPIWKDKRNVRITYTVYNESDSTNGSSASSPSLSSFSKFTGSSKADSKSQQKQERLDDVVEYQEAGSDRVKQVRGREYTSPGSDTRAWDGAARASSKLRRAIGRFWDGAMIRGDLLAQVMMIRTVVVFNG